MTRKEARKILIREALFAAINGGFIGAIITIPLAGGEGSLLTTAALATVSILLVGRTVLSSIDSFLSQGTKEDAR